MNISWESLYREILDYQKTLKETGTSIFFRGQSNSDWPLYPSIFRQIFKAINVAKREITEQALRIVLQSLYKSLYYKYKSRAWHLLNDDEKNDWGVIFSMRHFGIPTTLLDWTESFACALYFANLSRKENEDAAIFVMDAESFNEKSIGNRGLVAIFDTEEPQLFDPRIYHPKYFRDEMQINTMAVAPVLTNPRMKAQQSVFTVAGTSIKPLEEEFSGEIRKFVLPYNTYNESQDYLKMAGIKHFSYFPDLAGISHDVNLDLEEEIYSLDNLLKKLQT